MKSTMPGKQKGGLQFAFGGGYQTYLTHPGEQL
jgi:hypothetical protein